MQAVILPDGSKFAVWVNGDLIKDGFETREDAAWFANAEGYTLN